MWKLRQFTENILWETEVERRRRLLNILLMCFGMVTVILLLYTVYAGIVHLDSGSMLWSLCRISIVMAGGLTGLALLNRYWSSRLTSMLLASFLFVAIAWHVGFNAILLRNTFLSFTIPILVAGFLVYPWAGFVMATLISGWVVLLAIKLPEIPDLPAILIYFGVATMTWLFAQNLEQTLHNLRAANQDLDQRVAARTAELVAANAQLQQEIAERERIAAALRESEIRYRTLFDNTPVGIGLTDREGQLWTLNPVLAQMLGYTVDELQGRNVRTLYVNPEARDALTQILRKDGHVRNYETRLKRRDGSTFNASLTVTGYPVNEGPIWQAVILDITPQKQMEDALRRARDELELRVQERTQELVVSNLRLQAEIAERECIEAALRESEARYRALIDMSPDSIIVCNMDGTIIMCNAQSAALYGVSDPATLIGRNVFDFIVPEERERAIAFTQRTLEHGIVHDVEYMAFRADGARFPVEVSAAFIPDAEGKPTAFVGITRDITARKKAEEAVRRHNQELQALNAIATTLNQTHTLEELLKGVLPEILNVIGVDTGWIELRETAQTAPMAVTVGQSGCPEPPPEGLLPVVLHENLLHRVYEEGAPVLLEEVQGVLEKYRSASLPLPAFPVVALPIKIQKDVIGILGVAGILDCRPHSFEPADVRLLTTISSQLGLAVHHLHLLREATEAAALRELERLRSELVANFSHDLRTPLGLIKMSCTTLLREDVRFDLQTQREFLKDIETQADILTEIVDNILNLARLESGQLHLNKRLTDLEQLTYMILSAMQGRFTQHRAKCQFPETPLVADVDPKYIAELLRNLLDNAIKYSPNGGEITVTGALKDNHIIMQVRDQGIGIPPEALDKVFERFYRVDDEAIRHIGGVGLGLSVCQGIARAHGGRIEVASTPGQGSTFSVILPL